jgi:hypothetical protein
MSTENDEPLDDRWNLWAPLVLAECKECSALVMNKSDARANHEAFHQKVSAS